MGQENEELIATIWTIRDGRVVDVETRPTLEEALAVAGLPAEQPG